MVWEDGGRETASYPIVPGVPRKSGARHYWEALMLAPAISSYSEDQA